MYFRQFIVLICAFSAASAGFAGNAVEYNAENRGIMSSISNVVSKIPGLGSSASGPCEPATPMNLTALQNVLPPAMAKLVTQENLETIQNVGKLATLATVAATGNPAAIVQLIVFLASPDSPVTDLYNLGKEIVPHLAPAELAALLPSKETISGTVHNATQAITSQFQKLENGFQNTLNSLKPCKAPAPAAPEPALSAPAA